MHFVHELIKRKEEFYFLTNNAKRTKRQNVEHMERMGSVSYTHLDVYKRQLYRTLCGWAQ